MCTIQCDIAPAEIHSNTIKIDITPLLYMFGFCEKSHSYEDFDWDKLLHHLPARTEDQPDGWLFFVTSRHYHEEVFSTFVKRFAQQMAVMHQRAHTR